MVERVRGVEGEGEIVARVGLLDWALRCRGAGWGWFGGRAGAAFELAAEAEFRDEQAGGVAVARWIGQAG